MNDMEELDFILLRLLNLFPNTKFVEVNFEYHVMFEGCPPSLWRTFHYRCVVNGNQSSSFFCMPKHFKKGLEVWSVWEELCSYGIRWNAEKLCVATYAGESEKLSIRNKDLGRNLYYRMKQLHEVQSLSSIL